LKLLGARAAHKGQKGQVRFISGGACRGKAGESAWRTSARPRYDRLKKERPRDPHPNPPHKGEGDQIAQSKLPPPCGEGWGGGRAT